MQRISPLRLKGAGLAVLRHQKSALFVPAVEVWQPHVAQDARLMALLRGRAGIPTGMAFFCSWHCLCLNPVFVPQGVGLAWPPQSPSALTCVCSGRFSECATMVFCSPLV